MMKTMLQRYGEFEGRERRNGRTKAALLQGYLTMARMSLWTRWCMAGDGHLFLLYFLPLFYLGGCRLMLRIVNCVNPLIRSWPGNEHPTTTATDFASYHEKFNRRVNIIDAIKIVCTL